MDRIDSAKGFLRDAFTNIKEIGGSEVDYRYAQAIATAAIAQALCGILELMIDDRERK